MENQPLIDDKYAAVVHMTTGSRICVTALNDMRFASGIYHMRNAEFWVPKADFTSHSFWRRGSFEIPTTSISHVETIEQAPDLPSKKQYEEDDFAF